MKKTILFLVLFFGVGLGLSAQLWIQQGAGFTTASRGIQNIFAVNDQVVWASGYDGSGAGAACQDITVTTNGGTTWTPHIVNGATGLSISQICAVDANTAWVAMWKTSGSSLPGIFKTTDGGVTWTRQSTAAFVATSFPDIVYFFDANNGVTMGDPVGGKFEIYTTSNGGTTWTVVPSGNIAAMLTGEAGWTSDMCAFGNTIWFGTNKGRLYKSTDMGHNWTASAPVGMTGKNTFPAFKDANNGFCLKFYSAADTTALLDNTTNGGSSWSVFPYAGSVYNQMMQFVKGTTSTWVSVGVDAGAQPDRLGFTWSDDGGSTWYTDSQMSGTQLTWTEWVNDSTGWAGAFNTDATDGIFKFNSVLALQSNFMTNDTNIAQLDSAHFVNESLGDVTYHWTFQNGSPPSSTLKNPVVQYLLVGDWDVTLTVTGLLGSRTLIKNNYIHVGPVGINEHSKSSISIYPNPVKDWLNIKADAMIQEVQVFNIIGQTVLDRKVNNTVMSLKTNDLKPGVYNVKVKMNDGYIYQKVVVN
jgi:hypothetical protein